MSARLTRNLSRSLLALLVVALLAVAGCKRKEETKVAPAPSMVPAPQATAAPGSARVEVAMNDRGVTMPGTVLPGPTTLVIRNDGSKPHRLAVARGNEITRLDDAVAPGAEAQLQIDLKPGTYRAFCTFSDHRERSKQLVVTARRAY